MEMSDSQATALIKLLLEQQKDILHMKAHLLALEQAVLEHVGPELKPRLQQDIHALHQSAATFTGTRAAISSFEQLLTRISPTSDAKH